MAWTDLKASIAAVVKTNGTQAITGALLQSALSSIIDQVGANATFKGVATPTTVPGNPDGFIFYLAVEQGIYSNFAGFVHDGGIVVFNNLNGSWIGDKLLKTELDAKINITDIVNDLTTGGDDKPASANTVKTLKESEIQSIIALPSIGNLLFNAANPIPLSNAKYTFISAGKRLFTDGYIYVNIGDNLLVTKNGDDYNYLYYPKPGNKVFIDANKLNSIDLEIEDENKNAIAKFSNGHIQTKYFNSANITAHNIRDNTISESKIQDDAVTLSKIRPKVSYTNDQNSKNDLSIKDENGNEIARYHDGWHETKFPSPFTKKDKKNDLTIRDENGNIIAAFKNGHFQTKNFNSEEYNTDISGRFAEIETALSSGFAEIESALSLPYHGYLSYSNMIPIKVKKDGTGDFVTIQEAINSITDASAKKQYDIQVFDDFYCYDTTELWDMNHITQHATANPTTFVCFILTKDYCHIRGVGAQKTIYVESPADLAGASFQNIHNIYARGKCIINNFNFIIKGGRYASHGDDSGYNTIGSNAFSTQLMINCRFEHKGNYMYVNGSAWTAICASTDICLSSGCHKIFINDIFVSRDTPIYGHNAAHHEYPSKLTMINCAAINNQTGSAFPVIYDIGCGHKTEVEIINCKFNWFNCSFDKILSTSANRGLTNKSTNGGFSIHGHGNKLAQTIPIYEDCWHFKTIDNNKNITVLGGTAFNILWLENQRVYIGSSNAPGIAVSSLRICGTRGDTINYAYTLAYRLGNCATTPKTLIIKVDATEYTITFDQNYMTLDGGAFTNQTVPYISDSDILNYINSLYPTIFAANFGLPYEDVDSWDDCKEIGINFSPIALLPGDAVKRTFQAFSSWEKAGNGDNVDGIVAERIDIVQDENGLPKYNEGRIMLADKNLFELSRIGCPAGTAGTLYKIGSDGWEITTDKTIAQFVNISGSLVKKI